MSDLINVESSQLSVFNYGDIAKRYNQETADQLESLTHEGNGILFDAKIKFGNVLKKGKELVKHGDFTKWYSAIWGLSQQRVSDFINIAKAHAISPESGDLFPETLRSASTMAKAILNAPEEKREALVEDLKQEKEVKGKDLTEAQIKKLAEKYLKEKEEEIERLKEQVKETTQTSLFYEQEASKKLNEVNQLKETVDNQNKQIKELNSAVSVKENELQSLENDKLELDLKQRELDDLIAKEANVIAQETLEQERQVLLKKEADLLKKETQVKDELKAVQNLKQTAIKQKENFNAIQEWVNNFQLTNEFLAEATNELKKYKNKLQKNPNLLELEDVDRLKVEEKIKNLIVDFNDNLHNLGGAINYLNGAVVKFNNSALRVIDAEVTDDD